MANQHGSIHPRRDRRKIMAAIEAELEDIGFALEAISKDYIDRNNIAVNGEMGIKGAITHVIHKVKKGLRLEYGDSMNYAVYVHEGTKPHWPPHQPIRRWVRKKLNPPSSEIDSIAYAVQTKISKYGTKAQPFLGVAIRAMRDQIPGRIQAAIDGAINRET